jgi:hypothetical protein
MIIEGLILFIFALFGMFLVRGKEEIVVYCFIMAFLIIVIRVLFGDLF